MSNRIISLRTVDVRFPTSKSSYGSDATNSDPDYSAAYVSLETERGSRGFGLLFTIGRGNDICCAAIEAMRDLVIGSDLDDIKNDIYEFYNRFRCDSQLRWLGPEKGVVHMAAGAIVNAVWDMWARDEGKPVWRLLTDFTPEQFVSCIDFRYLGDVISAEEALDIVRMNESSKHERISELEKHGYPAYTTSPGWMGYSDDKLKILCQEALEQGFKHIKLKVGESLERDKKRLTLARSVIGDDVKLMIDANQIWEVDQAIDWVSELASFDLWFVEEPTCPDDVFGHKKIRDKLKGIRVATGEHCQNRVMFKQLISNDAIDVVQIDSCRLCSINEILSVYMLAAKYGKPVCPHAGGIGLCEYVQHLSMIDYVRISASLTNRVIEYVEYLHEHFEDPCIIRNGSYMPPMSPGFSIKMFPESIEHYKFPTGKAWAEN